MRRRIFLISLALVVFTGFSTAANNADDMAYSHEVELYQGENLKLNDYVFSYGDKGSTVYFEVNHDDGNSNTILKQVKRSELFESEGRTFDIPSEGLKVRLNRISSDEDGQYLNLTVASENDIFSDVDLSSSAPDRVIASRGESVTISMDVSNQGLVNRSFGLRAETNSSLETTFGYDGFNVTSVYVGKGETETVDARVEVPEETKIGIQEVRFYAGNGTDASESMQIDVKGAEKERNMDVNIDQIYQEVMPGESTEFRVEINNRGEAALEEINVTATPPQGWKHEIENGYIERMEGRGYRRETVMVTAEAPQDVEPGDYIMEVSAESKRTSMEEPEEVRLHVREKSGLEFIGGLLMAASLLILIIVYRKFQRR